MSDGIGKWVMRVGLALLVLGIGVGIWKLTHRPRAGALPESLTTEFRALAAETVQAVPDARALTQNQLDAMLYAAVGNASPAMVGWLLQRGADPRVNQKIHGEAYVDRSALQVAASRARCEQEKLLIARIGETATVSATGSKEQKQAAATAAIALFVNERDSKQGTPLHYAVLGGERACVAALLDAGARVDARDDTGATPLDVARDKFIYLAPLLQTALARQGAVDAGVPVETASARVPNAAKPTSNLPGALAQAETQAREWGPGGGPPVVIPTDSSRIQLVRPRGTLPARDPPAAPASAAGAEMVAFSAPAVDTMTPCGNAMTQTALRYRPSMVNESARNVMTWECRYLPTGTSAESKVDIDCDKHTLAAWSTVFFRGGTRLNETRWGEEMHAPNPATLEPTLLSLACALPQPSAVELGRASASPEAIAAALDACFAAGAKELPASPRSELQESAVHQIGSLLVQRCANLSVAWLYMCISAGSPRDQCTEQLTRRGGDAYRKSRS